MKTNWILVVLFALIYTGCETPDTHTHRWGAWTQTTPPTCTMEGQDTRVCSRNPLHIETRAVAIVPTAHRWGDWEGMVICTETGTDTRVCIYNAAHTEKGAMPVLVHNYVWTITTIPDCITAGVETGVCANDATHTATRAVAIDSNAHNYRGWQRITEPACTTAGMEIGTCLRNSLHTTMRTVPPIGHDYDILTVTIAPTCTEPGMEIETCLRNPLHKATHIIAAIDPDAHDWDDDYTTIIAATETTDGVKAILCKHDNSHTMDHCFNGIYATGTPRLAFQLINGSTAYSVRRGNVTAGVVYIPAMYRPNVESPYLPVTEIGNDAFETSGTSLITSVIIPIGVTSIGTGAFYGCTNLTSITIPDSVTSIGSSAFYNCTNLTSITIPTSVASIGDGAFSGCSNLTSITVDEDNPNYTSENGILYNKAKTELCAWPTASGSIIVPAGVTSIGNGAFQGCTGLTSITIPTNVTSIGSSAFYQCTNLTAITIPAGVTTIGANTFLQCRSLTTINIPANVTSIGNLAFYYCTGIKTITFAAGSQLQTIGNRAFDECTGLTELTFPTSLRTIGQYAFWDCTGIASIIIPTSITTISYAAFDGWRNTQIINVGYASQSEADAKWGSSWRQSCSAVIRYWNGTTYR